MNEELIIQQAEDYIKSLLGSDSSGHDYFHTLRVYKTALAICQKEKGNLLLVSLASLLHDADDYKLFPKSENYANARTFMNSISLDEAIQNQIIHIISQVSFKGKESEKPDSLEGMIVQDADRLDAIGAIGIGRAFAYGGSKGRSLYDPNIKPNSDRTFEEYKNSNSSTINHFYEKLLLLKEMMNTEEGRKIAEKKDEFMREFLREFDAEIDGKA
ncbi:MAG: HD domain-containing protein [Bacilli bacterium]